MARTIGTQPELTWLAHPARERVGPALVGAALIAALAALSGVMMQNAAWGVFAAAVLLLALNRFYLPSRFSIDAEGITARYPLARQRLRWAELRRFAHDRRGGYLSTRARPSWLDGYRGVHLLFGRQRDAVLACIAGHLPERAGP